MTKLEELKQKHATLREEILNESKAFFKEASAGLFDKYPQMESFSWTQYTPYFNDGEECVFRVNNYPDINGKDKYDNEVEPLKAAYEDVEKFIEGFDEPTMKEMFGDHCEITAKRDGVTVEEYSHE
jgi:hypothetical protein